MTDLKIDSKKDEFKKVDELADSTGLIDCYQIQVENDGKFKPVLLGKYPDVPLPVNFSIKSPNDKHRLYCVTYIMTSDEIKNKLFKIVGIVVFKDNESVSSLDMVVNENNEYQYILNDHKKNESKFIRKIDKFPPKDKVLEVLVQEAFKEDIVNKLLL